MSNQKEIREQLVKLITENPDLEIITLVDKDVVVDDSYDQWYGNLSRVKMDYYYNYNGENCLKSEDEDYLVQKFLDEYMEDEHWSTIFSLKDLTNMSVQNVEELDWKKVIVLHIGV